MANAKIPISLKRSFYNFGEEIDEKTVLVGFRVSRALATRITEHINDT